jgi:hypothetical protein
MDDVPNRNMVTFEISRNCLDLTNQFYAVAFVETDIYNDTTVKDFKYVPLEPYFNEMSNIPRPPKKKFQTINAYSSLREYTLDIGTVPVVLTSNSGLPVTLVSKSPVYCTTSGSNVILLNVGSCLISASSPGNDEYNPSNLVEFAFNILPKKIIPKVSQRLYFNEPDMVYVDGPIIDLDISAESGLPVQVKSTSPDICVFPFGDSRVNTYKAGTCSFNVIQSGDERYFSATGTASFEVYPVEKSVALSAPAKKKIEIAGSATTSGGGSKSTSVSKASDATSTIKKNITIVCKKKGAKNKIVSKLPCPKGYKQ